MFEMRPDSEGVKALMSRAVRERGCGGVVWALCVYR